MPIGGAVVMAEKPTASAVRNKNAVVAKGAAKAAQQLANPLPAEQR